MNDHDHFGRIAHILTTPKRSVLEALAVCGPMDQSAIVQCWRDQSPDLRPLVSQSLPRMVSQTIWKLDNLRLIEDGGERVWMITTAGRQALVT